MGNWEDAVESECVDPISFEPRKNNLVVNKGVANYLRLSLTIDRNTLFGNHFGRKEAVIIMKNPSTGTGSEDDKTLINLVKYLPQRFGKIHCFNITPVVSPRVKDLKQEENKARMRCNRTLDENYKRIKKHLDDGNATVIFATGKLGNSKAVELDDLDEKSSYQLMLRSLYDDLYSKIMRLQMKKLFEVKVIAKTNDTERLTGTHPGFLPLTVDPSRLKNEPEKKSSTKSYVIYLGEGSPKKTITPSTNPEMFEYPLLSI